MWIFQFSFEQLDLLYLFTVLADDLAYVLYMLSVKINGLYVLDMKYDWYDIQVRRLSGEVVTV